MTDEPAERLARIETQLAHLEHQVDQLNAVIIAQGREAAQAKKQLQRLATTLETIELDRIKATNPKPPHH
jgi:uncharacterized coiled-coil protein SlyX